MAMSPDESYIIVSYSATKRSPKSVYRIFDRRTSTFENVGPTKSGDETVKVLAWNPVGDDFVRLPLFRNLSLNLWWNL